jgi:hypothetical protein
VRNHRNGMKDDTSRGEDYLYRLPHARTGSLTRWARQ